MPPKHFVLVLFLLNFIFLVAFLFAAYAGIFDLWLLNKALPRLCSEQQNNQVVLKYCEEIRDATIAPTESAS